jgi:formylglycine-generating enzyme required for sulfatase activity
VLVGLGLTAAGGFAGIKIFAQPRSGSVTQKTTPSPVRIVYQELTPLTEQLPNGVELEMMGLSGGTFLMGSPDSDPDAEDDEFLQHEVTVPSFAIGKYPVTQAQWQVVMGNNPSRFDNDLRNPVEKVSWDDCQDFCKELPKLTGKTYRLPSEAEWEYACRAGTTTRYFFGDYAAGQLGDYAWYDDNSGGSTHPVGRKKPNPWGLYDMHGNVWEWCEDGWHENYKGAPTDGSAWTDNHFQDNGRVYRGGSWNHYSAYCRSAIRYYYDRVSRVSVCGLRLVCVSGFD